MPSPQACAAAFVAAVAEGDAAAAAAVCDADAWASEHGDSPRRLFAKASDPRRGFALQATGVCQEDDGLAAAQVALSRGDRALGEVALLCAQDAGGWRIVGVSDQASWAAAFVAGQVPALLRYDVLPAHDDSANAVVAVCALARRAKAGVGEAEAMLTELMNESPANARVIGRLQHLVTVGHRVRVRGGRWLPVLGRAVVHAEVLDPQADEVEETLWIHAEVGPPLRWRAVEGSLRAATCVA